jgi:hypothetical protein
MIMNYIKRLMGWKTEDYADITSQIQKQILKRRYADGKQNKLYRNPPKFSRSVVRYINLTSKGTENVIFLKRKN